MTMISFQEFLTENAPFHRYKGIKTFFTKHSLERQVQRAEFMPIEDFKVLVERVIDWLKANGRLAMHNEEFLVFSKSMNRGIIFAYRKDRFDKEDSRKHVYIITVLPKGRQNPRPGTPKGIVEGIGEYLASLTDEKVLLESKGEYDYTSTEYEGMKLFFVDGKFYDADLEFFEVE